MQHCKLQLWTLTNPVARSVFSLLVLPPWPLIPDSMTYPMSHLLKLAPVVSVTDPDLEMNSTLLNKKDTQHLKDQRRAFHTPSPTNTVAAVSAYAALKHAPEKLSLFTTKPLLRFLTLKWKTKTCSGWIFRNNNKMVVLNYWWLDAVFQSLRYCIILIWPKWSILTSTIKTLVAINHKKKKTDVNVINYLF